MTSKQKTGAVILSLLLLVGIVGYAYKQGKKETTIAKLPDDDTPIYDEEGNPVQNQGTETVQNLTLIAEELYEDMKGLNLFGHDTEPYEKAVNLSDIDFVRMYNIWNTKFQSINGETLKQMFQAETYVTTNFSIFVAFQNKLSKLNLK